MPFGIGIWELLILLVVLLLVFGAKRLPEMGRSLGRGMREFKEGVSGIEQSASEQKPPAELPSETETSASSEDEAPAATSEREHVS